MADRGATVMAIDIDTRFIEPFASDAIEVRRIDVRTDELRSLVRPAHDWCSSISTIVGRFSNAWPPRCVPAAG